MFRTSVVLGLCALGSGLASFATQVAIALSFGASKQLDIFLVAVSLPLSVGGTLTAALGYTLVPYFVRLGDISEAQKERTVGMVIAVVITALALSLIGGLIDTPLIRLRAPHLSEGQIALAQSVSQIAWANVACMIIMGLLGAVLVSSRRLVQPQVATLLSYLLTFAFLLSLRERLGVKAVAYATFLGSAATLPYLLACSRNSWLTATRWKHLRTSILDYVRAVPYTTIAVACFAIAPAIDALWAPYLREGEISFIGYCQRITVGLGTILIVGPSSHLAHTLAEKAFSSGRTPVLAALGSALRSVVLVALGAAIFLSVFSRPIVVILFNYGSFNENAVDGVAQYLPFTLAGMVPMLGVVLCFRALFALNEHRAAAYVSVLFIATYFISSFLLSHSIGFKGIGVAFVLSWLAAAFASVALLSRCSLVALKEILGIRYAVAIVTSSIAMYGTLRLISSTAAFEVVSSHLIVSVAALTCAAAIALVVFALVTLLICPKELGFASSFIADLNRGFLSRRRK